MSLLASVALALANMRRVRAPSSPPLNRGGRKDLL